MAEQKENSVGYIKKYGSRKDKELKYDFMPKMLEIIERPANKAGAVIIWGIFTLLIAVVIWASMSEVDIVITSTGNMQPVGNLNVVQAYVGGTVISINVTEGAYVEAGDVLIELDTQSLDIDVNQLNEKKAILELQQEVYTKIAEGDEEEFVDLTDYDSEFQPYLQTIIDVDTSYRNALANLELEKSNAELSKKIAQVRLDEYNLVGTEEQKKEQNLVIEQYSLAIEQIELQMQDIETQYSAQINAQLSDISNQLSDIESSLAKAELARESQQILAPINGYVNSIDVNTIGATISSGQNIITIVPIDIPMEMVCYVKNMDIADIELGMEAEIKLEAYPYNRFGTVKGIVTYISPSAFMSEKMGSVYLVKLDIVNENENINIISGLSGSVEIKTGKQTILDYFMEPIMKGFDESLKEG